MSLLSWLKSRTTGSRPSRPVCLFLEELEPRNLLAIASAAADVFTRFQDTINDPAAVSGPLFAESQAAVGPDLGRTVAHARALTAGLVQSQSQVGGVAGLPGVMDPSAAANALAVQASNYLVTGLPPGTPVALDATLALRGFLASQNFGSPSADLSTSVAPQLTVTTAAGEQRLVSVGVLNQGTLGALGFFSASDFVPSPGSTSRTPHYDIDLTRTLTGAFTVTAGEVFSVEARLQTFGLVEGPFELFTTADFFTDGRGFSFTLSAPGATVAPFNEANLALSRSGFNGPVKAGRTVNYTLTVTNNGPNAATGVTLTDSLYDGLALVSATPSQGSFTGDEHTLVYALGTLLPGRTATVEVVARANQVGTFARTASVTAEQPDSDLTDNLVSVTTTVEPAFADLAVTVDDEQDPVRTDRPIPYVITVTNNGPEPATGVTLDQELLGGLFSYSSIDGDLGPNRDRLTIDLGDLAPGASVMLRTGFFAPPGASGTVYTAVGVSAYETDRAPMNNVDFEETAITFPPASVYDFTLIGTGGVIQSPSINNGGLVAFRDDNNPSGLSEIQTGSESVFGPIDPTVITQTGSLFEWLGLYQTVNDAGTVAFVARNDNDPAGTGIFTGNGGAVTTIADATGELDSFGASPSINNAGRVAFQAAYDTGGRAIFLGDGVGPLVRIVDSFGVFGEFSWPNVNDRGQVAFHATLDAGGEGIFLWENGTVSTLVDSSGPFAEFTRRVSLNDNGAVAFAATLDNGESGVFVAENGMIRTVADSTGPFRDFGVFPLTHPALNNAGKVAFRATLDTGLLGIFTGPDPDADRVIVRGWPQFGRFVADMEIDWQGVNDAGQLALWLLRDDGLTLIVRGDLADHDRDGVLDVVEQGAPGGGDGNGDGVPDSRQGNVTSLPNAVNGDYVTLVAPAGTRLVDVTAATAPFPRPIGATFPFGVVGFAVEGLTPGQSVNVEVIVPGDLTSHTWFKHRSLFGWAAFTFDGTTGARAATDTIHGSPVTHFTLTLVDGNPRGDNDGVADGRIVDPGGAALLPAPVAAVVTITATPILNAPIDIKPGNRRNRLNLRVRGVLPVAILSTRATLGREPLDARTVDLSSIRFGDPRLPGRVVPIRHRLADLNRDGRLDLLVHFSIRAIRRNGALQADSTTTILTGLTRTGSGHFVSFEGRATVRVVSIGHNWRGAWASW